MATAREIVLTAGARNNNPLNLQGNPNNPWLGTVGTYGDRFTTFDSPVSGWRAAYLNGINHIRKNPTQTISDYINSFANSSSKKERQAYVNYVTNALGISPTTTLDKVDPYVLVDTQASLETRMTIDPQIRQRLQALLSTKYKG